jgi:alpha-D-ribose 1-methylphosphonate 5-triphosphate diphosphatase PhnM
MNRAIENLLKWLEIPAYAVWAMGTCNPAGVAGLVGKGVMQVGADADVVLWREENATLQAIQTWVAGRSVYECEPAHA